MPAEATADSSLTVSELQLRVEELGGQLRSQREEYLEALQREAAVAEIMRVINEPSADLSRVFSVMIERATQHCSASYGYVWLYDGERVHAVAASAQQTFGDWLRDSEARVPAEQSPLGQVLLNHRLVHVVDATEDEAYKTHLPSRELVDRGGVRKLLHVPLPKGNELLA
jgi:GAF domain-containing protein